MAMVERMAAFCHHIDRLPLLVKSTPGFLVNRLLMPYLLEAILFPQAVLVGEYQPFLALLAVLNPVR
ncbi:MAG: hypothetical protein G8345_05905 [Magnetococcales bacterium]|nr:hypothetical protein [Magnetococcales bacterium]NGZ26403.1 hypothetical protein [Magnetococcales bacterium]